MHPQPQQQKSAGLALVVVGLGLFALKIAGPDYRDAVLLVVGGGFLAGYLHARQYGLLVVGGILAGLGLGQLADARLAAWGDPSQLGLGAGFVAIYALSRLHSRRAHWWPLVPGLILIGSGVAREAAPVGRLIANGWPVALAALGLYLYFQATRTQGARG